MEESQKISEKNTPFPGELRIFSGPANPDLSKKIADCLGQQLGKVKTKRFSDDEFFTEYEESIRGTDVFIVQPTNQPDGHLFELLSMIYAARGASAGRVTAVIPYFGYARQDRKSGPRTPINAKLSAVLITAAGAQRVLLMDLHAGQIQGFFNQDKTLSDHIYSKPLLVKALNELYCKDIQKDNLVIVAPDGGATNVARAYAKKIGNAPIAIIDKRRPEPNKSTVLNIIFTGNLRGKKTLIVDDMVDTGGSVINTAYALFDSGVIQVDVACTHGVFSGKAIEDLEKSPISHIFVTDTISLNPSKKIDKVKIVSVAPLFAEAIKEIHNQGSVSKLFED